MTGHPPQLGQRTLSAVIFVPAVLGLTWLGGAALITLVAAIVGRGAWEFYHLASSGGHRPAPALGVALALGTVAWVAWRGEDGLVPWLIAVLLIGLVAALWHGVEGYGTNALVNAGGVFYVGLLGSAPLLIERLSAGSGALMALIFASIWLTDAGAYLCGSRWGVRRLMPRISPGKTVVGFAAGCVAGLAPAALVWLQPDLLPGWGSGPGLLRLLGLLAVVSVGGQAGDLVESALKRWAGVKDAPPLIPGHGGALDRFDSYLFAFPIAYLYLTALNYLAL